MGHDNLAIGQPGNHPEDNLKVKVMELPEAIQLPHTGFSEPHIDPGGHYRTLDAANGNLFPLSGATSSLLEVRSIVAAELHLVCCLGTQDVITVLPQ